MKLKKRTITTPKGRKAVIRYSPWFSPYFTKKGAKKPVTALQYVTKSQCGVYIIRSKRTKEILYVGHSSKQLYKTLYRHFQDWESSTQYRATYYQHSAYEIMIILTGSCDTAYMTEQYYIHKVKPRDGVRKLEVPIDEISFVGLPKPESNDDWKKDVPF